MKFFLIFLFLFSILTTSYSADSFSTQNSIFDIITAKAVAELPDIIHWTRRFLSPNGRWILWKGSGWMNEIKLVEHRVQLVKEQSLSTGGKLLILEESA